MWTKMMVGTKKGVDVLVELEHEREREATRQGCDDGWEASDLLLDGEEMVVPDLRQGGVHPLCQLQQVLDVVPGGTGAAHNLAEKRSTLHELGVRLGQFGSVRVS